MDRVEVLLRFQLLIFVLCFRLLLFGFEEGASVDFRVGFCMLSALCRFGSWLANGSCDFFLIDGGFPRKLVNFLCVNLLVGSVHRIWVEGLLRLVGTTYCCIA